MKTKTRTPKPTTPSAIALLADSLTHAASRAEYARRKDAHPALAPYATLDEVRGALGPSSPLAYDAQNAIVLAFIAEDRRAPRAHPVWQALLLVTYEGMLVNVKRRILGASRDDAEQATLAAFLEAVRKVPLHRPPSHLSLHLRHATERIAFRDAGRHDEPEMVGLVQARHERDPSDLREEIEENGDRRAVVTELVAIFEDEAVAREALEALLQPPTELAPRLQRLRARALARLELRFGPCSKERALRTG